MEKELRIRRVVRRQKGKRLKRGRERKEGVMYEPLAFGIREEAVVGTSNEIEAAVHDEVESNMVVETVVGTSNEIEAAVHDEVESNMVVEIVVGTSNKIEAEVQDEGEGNMIVIRASDNEDEGGDDGDDGDDGEDRIMLTRPARVSAPRARECFTQMEDDEYVVYQESYHEDSSYYL